METAIIILLSLLIYFAPSIVASYRKHKSTGAIQAVNFFLGWTLVGWLWALIWANTGNIDDSPTPETHIKCPDCRELILRDARVCKHCGCKLIPQ
jgi:hypothetical protein